MWTLRFLSTKLSFACMLHNIQTKFATSYAQKGWKFPMFIIDHLPHLHSCFPTIRVVVPLLSRLVFFGFLFRITKQGKQRVVYKLTMHYGLGLDCHGVGVINTNTHSLLLCFHPNFSFVMHDDIVILNTKFANL